MEPDGSLPQSQVAATCPYPEPAFLMLQKCTATLKNIFQCVCVCVCVCVSRFEELHPC